MNLSAILLFLVPGLPLLLAIPLLHRRIPCAEYLALLPAVALLLLPEYSFVETPWLLFGAGLGSDDETWLLLMMSVVLWIYTEFILYGRDSQAADCVTHDYSSTFVLLIMSGHLGTILANGLVGFFVFSTLMGYGFYGLMVNCGNRAVRKAGLIYLCLMVAADLLLFEAALIAASQTNDMEFNAVRLAMAEAPSTLYISMVLFGFALKAGFWPLQYWLFLAFRSARSGVAMLLAGVPVAIALLGSLRWLPLGEIAMPVTGYIIQGIGVAAISYTVVVALVRRQFDHLFADVTSVATALFAIALGTGLTDPVRWSLYADQMYIFIVVLSLGMAVFTVTLRSFGAEQSLAATHEKNRDDRTVWFGRWSVQLINWPGYVGNELVPRWHRSFLAVIDSSRQLNVMQKVMQAGEHYLQRWYFALTLLLLLALAVVVLLIT